MVGHHHYQYVMHYDFEMSMEIGDEWSLEKTVFPQLLYLVIASSCIYVMHMCPEQNKL